MFDLNIFVVVQRHLPCQCSLHSRKALGRVRVLGSAVPCPLPPPHQYCTAKNNGTIWRLQNNCSHAPCTLDILILKENYFISALTIRLTCISDVLKYKMQTYARHAKCEASRLQRVDLYIAYINRYGEQHTIFTSYKLLLYFNIMKFLNIWYWKYDLTIGIKNLFNFS